MPHLSCMSISGVLAVSDLLCITLPQIQAIGPYTIWDIPISKVERKEHGRSGTTLTVFNLELKHITSPHIPALTVRARV